MNYFVCYGRTRSSAFSVLGRLHNEGRMLDIYHRLHNAEEKFFLPFDLEISLYELNFIARKAEQWRGEEGERRKITVTDYVWEEELVCSQAMPFLLMQTFACRVCL